MLQPSPSVDSQQINEFKNKHKFMVQTTFADGDVNQESLVKEFLIKTRNNVFNLSFSFLQTLN